MFLSLWLLLHAVFAAAGTWLARRYAVSKQLMDQPGARRSHAVATPRGGGIAIVAVILLSMAWMGTTRIVPGTLLACFAGGLLMVAGIGWLDDHRPMSPWPRLFIHGLAAVVLAWGIHSVTHDPWLTVATFVLAAVLTNVWNFMDGIDGLAASQAAIGAFAMALALGGGWALLAMGLGAAVLGFLPFNFPKARIFLGDVGSGALGFLLAGLIALALAAGRVHWTLLALPFAAFLVDATFTLIMRMLRREKWWSPHVQHTYQRWAAREGTHVRTTVAYAVFSLLGGILMQVGIGWRVPGGAWMCIAWYAGTVVVWARMRRDVIINKDAQP